MRKEFSLESVSPLYSRQEINQAINQCADDIESQLPEMQKIQFKIKSDKDNPKFYEIDVRTLSKRTDMMTTIHTKNIFRGLERVTGMVLKRLRSKKNRRIDRTRRGAKKKKLKFLLQGYNFSGV